MKFCHHQDLNEASIIDFLSHDSNLKTKMNAKVAENIEIESELNDAKILSSLRSFKVFLIR